MLLENTGHAYCAAPAALPDDEDARLAALQGYCVLDTLPDKSCDQITELARTLFGVEIALISLVDEDRQWFKSRAGLSAQETPRSMSFCAHAILARGSLVVLDTHQDGRFRNNPLVTAAPRIRFYAGALLRSSQGHALGTLCLIDPRPREHFGPAEMARLEQLACMVMERLEQLRNRGYTDHVTGLPNRARLMEVLRARAHVKGDAGLPCAALGVDICSREYLFDMVKALGWDYAESFLVQVSRALCEALDYQPVYRVTTTTFVFLHEGTAAQRQEHIANVRQQFVQALEIHGIPHQLDIAIGVLPAVDDIAGSDVVRSLLTVIDVGREEGICPRQFESVHAENQRNAFWLLSALPMAFNSSDELSLHYQPKVRLRDSSCVGVEALIRWHHPVLGNISPAIFIALAEKTAQIRQITAWVVRHAVAQAAAWHARGHRVPIAINTSARDFESDDILRLLAAQLKQHAVPPGLIEIEFTESAMASNPAVVRQRVQAIRELGVKVAIDDFGSGFSNLSYLKSIPADIMKIDRSFISRLVENEADQVIVPSIIHLAHQLGFSVVAEGVESEQTARILHHLGCDFAQGYAIARPMPAEELEEWLGMVR
ncbi:sensor domain-containing phosphodiesterase [Herbaspirillum sp. C7C8]|uniref:putative bifunctional diguanylate cyclase/phosphodiesterase n=1 Tax=Herbaspirillum sp. C7C8 TaxID=2736665 RepID=UPI001F528EC8|nr:GGDEF and EAL domain-containing protein [Herbaspirillum sp. C7C8]